MRFQMPRIRLVRRNIVTAPGAIGVTELTSSKAKIVQAVPLHPHPIYPQEFTMLTPDQVLAAQKAQLEAMFSLGSKAVEGLEKIVELNIQTLKAALSETSDATLAALSAKDLQELATMQPNLAQPLAEKVLSYTHHVYEIASGTHAEFAKAMEANAADAHKKVQAMVDNVVKNAPAGTETAVAVIKSALNAANNAYDSVQKASKQAAEVVEANFNTVTNNALKAAQSTTPASRKRSA